MKQTTYHQADIRPFLVKHLANAKSSIQLAIGWIEDEGLIGLLEKKALEGVKVSMLLIVPEEGKKWFVDLSRLKRKKIELIKLDHVYREHLIDHKFGIIDSSVVLTGNYGWGNKNAPSEDSMTITVDLPTIVTGFELEYDYLCVVNHLSKEVSKPPNSITDLLKKMEIVKVLLEVGDIDYIHLRLDELKRFSGDRNIDLIIQSLSQKYFEEALDLIKSFLYYHKALSVCVDPPIDNLRREIRLLEEEIAEISNKYNETQKALIKFSEMHTARLGELLQKILYQNKLKAAIEAETDNSKQEKYEEAKTDHEEYTKSYEIAKKQKINILTPQEQKKLKKLYRQTSLKCHPDRVVEELHDQAEEIFIELNQAYKANNLERVIEINQQLKSGIFLTKSEGITELKRLESSFKNLTQKLQVWQNRLTELQSDSSYQTISKIEDWDDYFTEKKSILENQLTELIKFNKSSSPTSL